MLKHPIPLLIIQVLTIPLVLGIFRLPAEKAILSLAANVVFWIIGLLTISYRGPYKNIIMIAGLQFLITSVIPVTILRYLSWGGDFNTSVFLGVAGAQWHSYSNKSFMVMLLVSLGVILWLKFKKH